MHLLGLEYLEYECLEIIAFVKSCEFLSVSFVGSDEQHASKFPTDTL